MTVSPPYQASTIARWFLAWAQFEEEGALSHLKLQKLLYYAQGHYLANHNGAPLFAEQIQAWGHGPVVPSVYQEFKGYGADAIPFNEEFDFEQVDDDANSWLAAVWKTFGSRSAWKLREMTHAEPPWKDAYRDGEHGIPITLDAMTRYFGTLYTNVDAV